MLSPGREQFELKFLESGVRPTSSASQSCSLCWSLRAGSVGAWGAEQPSSAPKEPSDTESAEPTEGMARDIQCAADLEVLVTPLRSRTKSRASSSKEGTFWCGSTGVCSSP